MAWAENPRSRASIFPGTSEFLAIRRISDPCRIRASAGACLALRILGTSSRLFVLSNIDKIQLKAPADRDRDARVLVEFKAPADVERGSVGFYS